MATPSQALIVVGDAPMENGAPKRGTEVTFLPSPATFTMVEFDYATIEHGCANWRS